MAKRILKALTNNFGFKMLALVFAFMLWLVVYNIEDPVITRPYTAIVSVKNEDKVTDMNKCFEILDGSNIVTFSVSAKRSMIEKLEDSDFSAVADMNNLIMAEDGTEGEVRIDISSSRYSSVIKINGKTQYMKLALENMLSKQFVITPNTDGAVAEGYALGSVMVANPNVLKVSGPESIVGQISCVVATIDVDGMTMDLRDNVIPVLYDAEGKEIPTTNLKLSNTTVQITAQILGTKQVPLKFSTVGTPAGGNSVLEIVCKPAKVTVKGTAAVLNQISSIEVPAEVLNVADVTEDLETTIDITEYLPANVELVNATEANVSVVVKIERYKTRNYTVGTDSFEVVGLEVGQGIEFESENVVLSVSGSEDNMSKLSISDIRAKVDVKGLGEGRHLVEVDIDLDGNIYTWSTIEVYINLKTAVEDAPSEGEEDGDVENDGNEDLEENQEE